MPSDFSAAQHWLREPEGAKQADAPPEPGRAGEPGTEGEGADGAAAQLSLAEWKAQQIQKKTLSTRERLRDEYAQQAARIELGDRCEIGGYKGEVVFLGDEVEGLPGGYWVGIRYDEPVGKNDGTVKGQVYGCRGSDGCGVRLECLRRQRVCGREMRGQCGCVAVAVSAVAAQQVERDAHARVWFLQCSDSSTAAQIAGISCGPTRSSRAPSPLRRNPASRARQPRGPTWRRRRQLQSHRPLGSSQHLCMQAQRVPPLTKKRVSRPDRIP